MAAVKLPSVAVITSIIEFMELKLWDQHFLLIYFEIPVRLLIWHSNNSWSIYARSSGAECGLVHSIADALNKSGRGQAIASCEW